jgi:ElaB/YqjD/DUF883 family membrane-anchored ribosome-binding protein
MSNETPDGVARPDFQPSESSAPGTEEPPLTGSWPGPETQEARERETEKRQGLPGRSELEDIAVEAERLVRDGIEQTERRIRRNPLAAVSIAAGVGIVLGILLSRDR